MEEGMYSVLLKKNENIYVLAHFDSEKSFWDWMETEVLGDGRVYGDCYEKYLDVSKEELSKEELKVYLASGGVKFLKEMYVKDNKIEEFPLESLLHY